MTFFLTIIDTAMTKYAHSFFYFLISLLLGCQKEDNPYGLPPATQSGANTFGCLIDGKPWIADIAPDVLDPALRKLDMSYDETGTGKYYNNNWRLSAKAINDSIDDIIGITARAFDRNIILNKDANSLRAYLFYGNRDKFYYIMDATQINKIEITKLDTFHNICSGRFDFFAITSDKSDTIHITEGRFDKKYDPE